MNRSSPDWQRTHGRDDLGRGRARAYFANEDTLWSAEPYDNANSRGRASLPEIHRLLLAGDHRAAQSLIERDMNGRNNRCYQPLADLLLDFHYGAEASALAAPRALGHPISVWPAIGRAIEFAFQR